MNGDEPALSGQGQESTGNEPGLPEEWALVPHCWLCEKPILGTLYLVTLGQPIAEYKPVPVKMCEECCDFALADSVRTLESTLERYRTAKESIEDNNG